MLWNFCVCVSHFLLLSVTNEEFSVESHSVEKTIPALFCLGLINHISIFNVIQNQKFNSDLKSILTKPRHFMH